MMLRVRLRVPVLLLALLLPLDLLAGCGGGGGGADSADDPPRQLSYSLVQLYFEAVASYRVDSLASAAVLGLAAEGSPALAYLKYLGDFAASAVAAGQPVEGSVVKKVTPDHVFDGLTACGGSGRPDECVTWADFEGDDDGLLTDFTVNGTKLDDSLVDLTDQPPVSSSGVYSVEPDYAYRSPQSGSLFVLVTITASDTALAPKPGIYIEEDQILHGVRTRAPASIAAGTSSPVILAFPNAEEAELDGQVTFDLGIEGAGAESIGFGLAEPAPA
jgi:hypothetical protein